MAGEGSSTARSFPSSAIASARMGCPGRRIVQRPAKDEEAARMMVSRASWVSVGGKDARSRDWWRRVSERRGCEAGVRFAEVRMGAMLVVSWRALGRSNGRIEAKVESCDAVKTKGESELYRRIAARWPCLGLLGRCGPRQGQHRYQSRRPCTSCNESVDPLIEMNQDIS